MKVETAELERHLSEYVQRVRSTGEPITVCQGNEPVAMLAPITSVPHQNGKNMIEQLLDSPHPVGEFTPLARAFAVGAEIFYTEDMQDGLLVGNALRLVNPFVSKGAPTS